LPDSPRRVVRLRLRGRLHEAAIVPVLPAGQARPLARARRAGRVVQI